MEPSKKLFARRDGRGMCFYLPPSVRDKDGTRSKVKELVEKHGGRFRTPSLRVSQDDTVVQLVHVGDAGNEKALLAAEERGEKLYYCTYVLDSVAKRELLKLEDYEVQLPPASVVQKRTHYRWTPEEDNALMAYAAKSILARRGDTLWEEAERQHVTHHTWQAMKERYNKYLAPAQKAKATIPTPLGGNVAKDPVSKPNSSHTPLPTPLPSQPQKQTSVLVPGKPASRSAAQPTTSYATSSKQIERPGVEPKRGSAARIARAAAESEAGSSRVDPIAERNGDSRSEREIARAAKTAESRTEGRSALSSLTEEPTGPQLPTNTAPAAAQSSRPPFVAATRSEPLPDIQHLSPTPQGQSSQPATSLIATPRTEVPPGREQANQNVKPQISSNPIRNAASPLVSQTDPHPKQREQLEDARSVPRTHIGKEGERPKRPVVAQAPPGATLPTLTPVRGTQSKELQPSYLLKPLRGAAVLRASPKPAPVSKPVTVTVGAAASACVQGKSADGGAAQLPVFAEQPGPGRDSSNDQEGGLGRVPMGAHWDPFTQEPAVGYADPAGDDWQESQEGPEASGKPAGPTESVNVRGVIAAREPEPQGSREVAGLDGRRRLRDDPAALPVTDAGNGKKQRVGPQKLLPKEKAAGSFSAVLLEGDGEELHGEGEGVARELRKELETGNLPAGNSKRTLDGQDDGNQAGRSNEMESEERRMEPNGAGVIGAGISGESREGVVKTGRMASNSGEGHGQGEERAEASGPYAQEGKRRRLHKVNGKPVAGIGQPSGDKPDLSTQAAMERTSADSAPERVFEIRSWVATFMKEYGCSQDDVIKALINASGKFEAARPFLDVRNRGNVGEPGWGLREDHVLLTMPVEERYKHPAFISLRQMFGDDAVEQRLRFLGRLGPK